MLRWDAETIEQMKRVEHTLVAVLQQFRDTTHPLLIVFTLMRVTRVFLRKASREDQKMVLPAIFAYLAGKRPEVKTAGGVIVPPEVLH